MQIVASHLSEFVVMLWERLVLAIGGNRYAGQASYATWGFSTSAKVVFASGDLAY